jgi:hypothetical protein
MAGSINGNIKLTLFGSFRSSAIWEVSCILERVRVIARQLTGADRANFVLRGGDGCFYADEGAISPL